jgi:hypothetical protein
MAVHGDPSVAPAVRLLAALKPLQASERFQIKRL